MDSTNPNRQFSLALEALAELGTELRSAKTKPIAAPPSLDGVLAEMGPMPREALFLGIASDGLPVLLNLHDPTPGPILVATDPGGGKTTFLQNIALGIESMHAPEDVQFGVITNYPDEWAGMTELPHCAGIFPFYHDSSVDFLFSLTGWAHANKNGNQSVLLLLDDLGNMESLDFDSQQSLRYLLLRGPSRRVWPVVTVNAERGTQVESWLEAFRTRIFGRIRPGNVSRQLTGNVDPSLFDSLQTGIQFALCEGRDWIKFWIPAIE